MTYKYTYVMEPVSYSEFRQNLAHHLDVVTESREPLIITRQGGKEPLVLMPLIEFEGWQETVHVLKSPANATALYRSMKQAADGNFVNPAELMVDSE